MEGISSYLGNSSVSVSTELIKSSMMQNANAKIIQGALDGAQAILDMADSSGYVPDSVIPENSTISYHV